MSHRTAAVIVLYRPERDSVAALVRALAGDVERIFLYLNAPPEPRLVAECAAAGAPSRVETLGSGVNVGLGRAYNEGAAAARAGGCERLLLFDEDSRPVPGIAARLAAAFGRARCGGGRVAAIGPLPIAAGRVLRRRGRGAAGLRDVRFLISSGSLIDLAALSEIGPFREDFFIDGIDIEWCFRARSLGYRCVLETAEAMPHRLGRGVVRVPLLGLRLTDQSPARLFTHARNQAAMLRLPHVPSWWKARTAVLIALRLVLGLGRGRRGRDRAAILRGLRAGLRRELGPPGDAAGRRAG